MISVPIPTGRTLSVQLFIQRYVEARGYPPMHQEIAGAVGLVTSSAVNYHMVKLEKHGYIERDRNIAGKARNYRVWVWLRKKTAQVRPWTS